MQSRSYHVARRHGTMPRVLPDVAFDLELTHGRCVGVRLPEAPGVVEALAEAALMPEERAYAATLGGVRRRTWMGGRVALRQALVREGIDAPPVLADGRGAPALPPGVAGSISHKEDMAVALVAREGRAKLGVDVERDAPGKLDISKKVLTDEELAEAAKLSSAERAREVLLRFSAKEAIYKALDPFVQRYVAFREVAVTPRPDGSAVVTSRLPAAEGPFVIDVQWVRCEGTILTTARVEKR
ncbi:MAG TPA: 4'-phosphopantetheinyl transferase superfamily protein [Polyangiaceae bacterium]